MHCVFPNKAYWENRKSTSYHGQKVFLTEIMDKSLVDDIALLI
jgi:hypothetical protein